MSRIFVSPRATLRVRVAAIQNRRLNVSATCTNSGASTIWMVIVSLRDAHELLAEVLALQEPDESLRRVLQPIRDILAILDAALLDPLRHVADEVGEFRRKVGDDEAADREPLGQHGAEEL